MQLPNGPFGPIPVQVTLDGSGNGTVTFQPNGKNARITNLMVKVSTIVNQAVCTIYLGQVSDSNIIMNTNSGSTGAPGSGRIDVLDGQTLYVVWTGGDAGAIATATFVGTTIPFGEVGTSEFDWDNPIAAGDGSLIYPALRSPNFEAGVSGWRIARDGSVEFSSAVIRGNVSAANGTVVLNDAGVYVTDEDSLYIINTGGGFGAYYVPEDGRRWNVQKTGIFGHVKDPSVTGLTSDSGSLDVSWANINSTERPYLRFISPNVTGYGDARFLLYGEANDGTPSHVSLVAGTWDWNVDEIQLYNQQIIKGIFRSNTLVAISQDPTDSGAVGTTETVVLSTGSVTFRRDRAYRVESYSKYTQSAAAATQPIGRFRKTNSTGTVLLDKGRWSMPAVTTTIGQDLVGKFTVGSTDVTATIVMTLQTQSGTLIQKGDSNTPRNMAVYDIGDAVNYPDFPVLS